MILDFRLGEKYMKKIFWIRFFDSQSDNPKSKIQNRKWAGFFAVVITLTVCGARAEAQQPAGIPRIGLLFLSTASVQSARVEVFRQRLRELGYVEKTSSLSTDTQMGNSTGSLTLQPNWCVSKLTSSSPPVWPFPLLRRRARLSPSYSPLLEIQ